MTANNTQQSSAPVTAIVVCGTLLALFFGGAFDRLFPSDEDEDRIVASDIADSVYRGNISAAVDEARILRRFASDLRREKFRSAGDMTDQLTKEIDDSRREHFEEFQSAMEAAMKGKDWESDMADVIDEAANGFERFGEERR